MRISGPNSLKVFLSNFDTLMDKECEDKSPIEPVKISA